MLSIWERLRRVLRWEWTLAIRHRGIWISTLGMMLLSLIAFELGRESFLVRSKKVVAAQRDNQNAISILKKSLSGEELNESESNTSRTDEQIRQLGLSPMLISHAAKVWTITSTPSPLAIFASGASSAWPDSYPMVGLSRSATLEKDSRLPPRGSLPGSFDLTFLLVAIAPLFIIAATYDLLASDKLSGTSMLVAVQATSISLIAFGRSILRGGIVIIPLLVLPTVLLFTLFFESANEILWMRGSLWIGSATLYLLGWMVLGVIVNGANQNPLSNAGFLLLGWIVVVFAIPMVFTFAIESTLPLKPYSALIHREKELNQAIEKESEQYATEFLSRLPSEVDREQISDEMAQYLAVQSQQLRAMEQEYELYQNNLLRRGEWQDIACWFSPVIAMQTASENLAGTSDRDNLQFARFVGKTHTETFEHFVPAMAANEDCSLELIDSIPSLEDDRLLTRLDPLPTGNALAALFTWLVVLTMIASWALRFHASTPPRSP